MFRKHYINPLRQRGRKVPYDPRTFFDSWYRSQAELTDLATIARDFNPLFGRYHYNATENSIIEFFTTHGPPSRPEVLDLGSGAGHWIRFYRDVFAARRVVGADISRSCVEALRTSFSGQDQVEIICGDFSSPDFELGRRFDIVNAIGVVFHIVEDDAWRRALANLARHLSPDGYLVVGGQFGWITQNVQFHKCDDFERWEERQNGRSDLTLYNKRIRSLRAWKRCARSVGLRVLGLRRTRVARGVRTPENNILVLGHAR